MTNPAKAKAYAIGATVINRNGDLGTVVKHTDVGIRVSFYDNPFDHINDWETREIKWSKLL